MTRPNEEDTLVVEMRPPGGVASSVTSSMVYITKCFETRPGHVSDRQATCSCKRELRASLRCARAIVWRTPEADAQCILQVQERTGYAIINCLRSYLL